MSAASRLRKADVAWIRAGRPSGCGGEDGCCARVELAQVLLDDDQGGC